MFTNHSLDRTQPGHGLPARFLILCRTPNQATSRLHRMLSEIGLAEVVSDQPASGAVWVPDHLMGGFEELARWSADGPPITAWERALKHLAVYPVLCSGVWFVEDDVAGPAECFARLCSLIRQAESDFAAIEIVRKADDHGWPHWHGRSDTFAAPARSFNPLCFLSPSLLQRVLLYRELHGRFMFLEILFASLASSSGARVLDFAHDPDAASQLGTFRFRPLVETDQSPGISHPVKDLRLHEALCSSRRNPALTCVREHSPA